MPDEARTPLDPAELGRVVGELEQHAFRLLRLALDTFDPRLPAGADLLRHMQQQLDAGGAAAIETTWPPDGAPRTHLVVLGADGARKPVAPLMASDGQAIGGQVCAVEAAAVPAAAALLAGLEPAARDAFDVLHARQGYPAGTAVVLGPGRTATALVAIAPDGRYRAFGATEETAHA